MTLAEYIRQATDERMAEVILVLHKVFADLETPPSDGDVSKEQAQEALGLPYAVAVRLFKKLEPANAKS